MDLFGDFVNFCRCLKLVYCGGLGECALKDLGTFLCKILLRFS